MHLEKYLDKSRPSCAPIIQILDLSNPLPRIKASHRAIFIDTITCVDIEVPNRTLDICNFPFIEAFLESRASIKATFLSNPPVNSTDGSVGSIQQLEPCQSDESKICCVD